MRLALQTLAVASLGFLGLGALRGGEDPAGKWLSVYAWIRTGESLAGAEQWPIALGAYLEASRQLEELASAHPAFEPEMVGYRRGTLLEIIAGIEARLTTDEHETMMKFLDFIESLALGEAQRFGNDFEEAFGTLAMAGALLDEISGQKPAAFREAVAPLRARLESSLSWVGQQLDFKAANRPRNVAIDGSIDWGTTRFVREGDLPKPGRDPAPVGGLFPGAILAAAESPEPATAAEEEPDAGTSPAAPRFRMSSRQPDAPTSDPLPVPAR